MSTTPPQHDPLCVAVLEIRNLSTAFVVADVCAKAGAASIVDIESNAAGGMAIKLVGPLGDAEAAMAAGRQAAEAMHSWFAGTLLPRFPDDGHWLIRSPQEYNAILGAYDHFLPKQNSEGQDDMKASQALGLIETQGLVGVIEATDAMLKAGTVELIGKEKIGAAYVTVMVAGDVASVRAAVDAGRRAVEALGQKLICAHVIPRPHNDLLQLLPARAN